MSYAVARARALMKRLRCKGEMRMMETVRQTRKRQARKAGEHSTRPQREMVDLSFSSEGAGDERSIGEEKSIAIGNQGDTNKILVTNQDYLSGAL